MMLKGPVSSAIRLKCSSRRPLVLVRSTLDGVTDLLARDRKQPKLVPELSDDPQAAVEALDSSPPVIRTKKQRRQALLASNAGASSQKEDSASQANSRASNYKKCKDALDAGLTAFERKDFAAAVDLFNLALELPGNGAYRLSGSPREYSCPSDAEEAAALYNMACAYAQMGTKSAALTCLEAVMENGYEDYQTLRTDPDLACLQPELDRLVARFDSVTNKVSRMFSKKEDKKLPWWQSVW